jgi:glycosyltransferase involved in cell wall biosynthesis
LIRLTVVPWIILSSLALIGSLTLTWWLHRFHRFGLRVTPGMAALAGNGPLIAVIVPARNEARNIRRCVEGLLAQRYPNLIVIVVDDGSTDDTPQVLAELASRPNPPAPFPWREGGGIGPGGHPPKLRVVRGEPLPPGWAGKPHALMQGVRAAPPESAWYCFVDADTFAEPNLIGAAYAAALAHGADMLSLFTYQELSSFWERVIMPLVFSALAVGFPPDRVNDPARREAVANGQFIFIRRAAYEAVGGHAALRGSIVEDKVLAENVKRAGLRLILADGRTLARTRMYTGLAEVWQGWTKNIYLGLDGRLPLLIIGIITTLAGALFLPGWLIAGAAWLAAGGGLPAVIVTAQAALTWLAVALVRTEVSHELGISRWYALTLPLGAAIFAAMMLTSALRGRRGVRWKGRTYEVQGA